MATIHRAAFLVTPHMGGTFSVYRNLRSALSPHGITLQWAGFSRDPDAIPGEPQFAAELSNGHLIDARNLSDTQAGAALTDTLIQQNFDLVFINVLTSLPEMSVAAYLPPHIRRVMIVHNITPGTFTCTQKVGPFIHAAVGVCPRICDHMINALQFSPARAFCVPNALDTTPFDNLTRAPFALPLRILFLGRVVDTDKGVFWLAPIMKHLRDLPVELTIAGDGPDLPALKKRLAEESANGRIQFLGRIPADQVPALNAAHHIFLMTSRFEGLPYSLIEALAAGTVPVASRIRGVTDYVIQENKTGLLFDIGDATSAAHCIRKLAADPTLHVSMSAAARADARQRFSIESFGQGYAQVLARLPQETPATKFGQPFKLLPFGRHWQQMMPMRLKNFVRKHLIK